MDDWAPTLLVEVADERFSARRRETFLLSVIIHLLVILVLVTTPELFQRRLPLPRPEQREVTMLYAPPPERPKLPAPKPSEEVPKIQPRLEEPSRQLLSRLFQPPPPQPVVPRVPEKQPGRGEGEGKDLTARQLPPIGIPNFPEPPKEPPKQRPTLEPVPRAERAPSPSQAQLTLPALVPPSRGTEDILRGMAKEHAAGGGNVLGEDYPGFDPSQPGLNIPGPQILSDTMGVDFQPYLLRIYLVVRRNWYSVIPEIARLGRQGRVVLQFTILRDGTVPDLTMLAGSGTTSMDTAALSSIRLSNPFPALPPEFPGDHILLRFIYLYNMPVNYQ
ncbi:MAG: energy transducer TonB [Acidobacteria bacterium]|nr:energy transducer TonB [Acidobacteriota bacterium]